MQTEKTIILAPYGLKSSTEAYPPNFTQLKVLEWVDNIRHTKQPKTHIPILYLQGGVGCIAEGQEVLMASGEWQAIEKVKKGEKIVSFIDNQFKSAIVEDVIYSGEKECNYYKDSAGQEILCTPDHRILKFSEAKKRNINQWKSIDEMARSYYGRSQVYSFLEWNTEEYPMSDEEIKFIAYMLTDGSYGKTGQSPKFTNINNLYLNEFEICYKSIFKREVKKYKKGNGYDYLCTMERGNKRTEVNDYLENNKICYTYFSLRQLGLFFNRVISADGSIYYKERSTRNTPIAKVCIYTGWDKLLTLNFKRALRRLGVIVRVFKHRGYELHITGNTNLKQLFKWTGFIYGKESKSNKILKYLEKEFKQSRFKQNNNARLVSFQKDNAQAIGIKKTYDLTIQNSNNFIVNGLLVHNSGKSRGIMAPIIEMLLEIVGLRVLWVRNDLKDLKLSIMDKFFEVLPPEVIAGQNVQYNYWRIKQNDAESRIYFNGAKDISGLGSQEFGVIAVTEAHEITYQSYMALKRRCRQEGVANMILMESEAPNEDHWLAKVTNPEHPDYDPDIEMWKVSTYENAKNLPIAYMGSLESMPEAWKKKYLQGEFGFIPDGEPFYQNFKEAIHKREIKPLLDKPLLLGWDYGFRHPACAITQIDAKGRWGVLRELIGTNITIEHFKEVVKEYLNLHFKSFTTQSYGDPAGTQRNDKSEQTSEDILRQGGFNVTSTPSTYRQRKEIIEGKLSTLIDGTPALCIDPACKTIIDGFLGGYHYPMIKQGQQFTVLRTEQPYKDGFYEHIMNGLEYIAVNVFSPVKKYKVSRGKMLARHDELRRPVGAFGGV